MRRKALLLLSLCAVLVFLLSGCGNNTAGNSTTSTGGVPEDSFGNDTENSGEDTAFSEDAQTDSKEQISAAGYDILGGQLWEVGGVLVRNKVVDIHDHKDLESLYRANYLHFGSDGRFLYLDTIPKGGTYEPYETEGDYASFLLKTDQLYQYDTANGELVERTSGTKKPYIIYALDDNTLEFIEFDPLTGKAKANEIPLFFVKSHEESPYVQEHKTEIARDNADSSNNVAGNSDGRNSDSGSKDSADNTGSENSSYQSILDTYTEKMEQAVPGLISEYRSEAAGVSDLGKLAEISNNKITKLAEICNEGVGKMAELMNSRGDSYSTYENWSGKLLDNYADIAQEIQDAYLDSAMD